MDLHEIRLECLRLACSITGNGEEAKRLAADFWAFVTKDN